MLCKTCCTALPYRRFLVGFALAAAALATWLAAPAGAANPAVYSDAAGDAAGAPDITQVTLTDNGNGTVGFDIAFNGDLSNGATMLVDLDTDRNRSTGDQFGAEYVVVGSDRGVGIGRSDFTNIDHHALNPTLDAGHLRFTLTLSDLGATSFDFFVGAVRGNDVDVAPDTGRLGYPQVDTPPAVVQPEIRSILLPFSGLLPKAGKVFRLPAVQVRLDDDRIVTPESTTCHLTYRGKELPSVGACAWKIPKSYRKKSLVLSIHTTYQGATGDFKFTVVAE